MVGIKGPIKPGVYRVAKTTVSISYPRIFCPPGFPQIDLPKALSTLFEVTWDDEDGKDAQKLQSKSFERFSLIYFALDIINELLLAFKLVRLGHSDSLGIRTIGIGDTLVHYSIIDRQPTGDLNIGLKTYGRDYPWVGGAEISSDDPFDTTTLAIPHIATKTYPVARRYVRCYELLEHGFYTEAFIVAFSILDDLVQQMLHKLLTEKGMGSKDEREGLLRGIKESRLKFFFR